MGLFSGIAKAVKSIFKGVSKVFKAVGNAVKSFAKSNLGKIVLPAAAVWLGGAALGYWNTGFTSIDGALAASQTTAAGTGSAATEAAAAGAGTAATEGAAATATGGLSGATEGATAGLGGFASAPEVSAYSLAPKAGSVGLMQSGGVGLIPPPTALTPSLSGGFMSAAGKAVSGAAKWMEAHPIPTLVGGQMLASAFSPNQLDVNEQQNQYLIDQENRKKAEIDAANARIAEVGNIPTWSYSGAKLPPPQPPRVTPVGIFGRRLL